MNASPESTGAGKPRVTITLDPLDYELLVRMARLEGRSLSSIVRELVRTVRPGLQRAVDLGEAYEAASEEARDAVRRVVNRLDVEVGPDLEVIMEAFQEVMAQGLAAASDPPVVITGVRSPSKRSDKGKLETRSGVSETASEGVL